MFSNLSNTRSSTIIVIGLLGVIGWSLAIYTFCIKENKQDKLSASHVNNYIRAMVWFHSRGKLQELKSIIQTENINDVEATKLKIKNMLMHRTSAYIRDFNYLDGPIPKLGYVYEDIFDFDTFLGAIYKVVFDPNLTVDTKIAQSADIMEEYQVEASNKLRLRMKKQGDS